MDSTLCGLLRDGGKMKEYKAMNCGDNVLLENCSFYNYRLKQNTNNRYWQGWMDDNNCENFLSSNLTKTVSGVYDTYSARDKQRIEEESKYQRNKKIFIGGMVLLTVLGIIIVKKN